MFAYTLEFRSGRGVPEFLFFSRQAVIDLQLGGWGTIRTIGGLVLIVFQEVCRMFFYRYRRLAPCRSFFRRRFHVVH